MTQPLPTNISPNPIPHPSGEGIGTDSNVTSPMQAPRSYPASPVQPQRQPQYPATDTPASMSPVTAAIVNAGQSAQPLYASHHRALAYRHYLIVDDFYPYFDNEDTAHDAFAQFDKDGNGDVSRREMKWAIVSMFKERQALDGE
jgi:hypothetical protein